MRVSQGIIEVKTRDRFDIVDITDNIVGWLSTVKAGDGILVAYIPHTTAALTVNETEPGLFSDILELLKELTKPGGPWRHNTIDDNAHAHLGSMLIDNSKVIPIAKGRLSLGTWQRLLLVEMDGPRTRRVNIVYLGD